MKSMLPTSIQFWLEPPSIGIYHSFYVDAKSADGSSNRSFPLFSTNTTVILTELQPGQHYDIFLYTVNSFNGNSAYSRANLVSQWTSKYCVRTDVTKLKACRTDCTGLELHIVFTFHFANLATICIYLLC